jgi:hypothetical protein
MGRRDGRADDTSGSARVLDAAVLDRYDEPIFEVGPDGAFTARSRR